MVKLRWLEEMMLNPDDVAMAEVFTVEEEDRKALLTKVVDLLKNNLSPSEMIEFGDALDGGYQDELLELVNLHLRKVSPWIFAEPEDC